MNEQVIGIIGEQPYTTTFNIRGHEMIADEPIDENGQDLGPKPTEYLKAALAACTTITMKMYADRKGWDLQEAIVEVDFVRDLKNNLTTFTKKVTLKGNLDAEQRKRIFEIGGRCPVHRIIENPVKIEAEMTESLTA